MLKNISVEKIKTVFMGTSELSETILQTIIDEKYNLVGVFTKPDAKIGRKQNTISPAVKILAQKNNIPVFQPIKFKNDGLEQLKKINPDLIIVAAYGKILTKEALEIPKFGCINVHVSLLPKYRGASPIQNALLNGDSVTGSSIMLMNEGIDTGDILKQEKIDISKSDNNQILTEKLADLGAKMIKDIIPLWINNEIEKIAQKNEDATYCKIIKREDALIDWNTNAEFIYNKYRAFTPWPGIFSYVNINNKMVRIKLIEISYKKIATNKNYLPGEIVLIDNDICISTKNDFIIIKSLQKEGKKVIDIKSFLLGHPTFLGSILK